MNECDKASFLWVSGSEMRSLGLITEHHPIRTLYADFGKKFEGPLGGSFEDESCRRPIFARAYCILGNNLLFCYLYTLYPSIMIIISSLAFVLPSILKLDPLASTNINRSTFITPPLLLILLLCKSLPLCDTQILVCAVCVIIAAVRIR